MRFTNDPVKARTIWQYTPFVVSMIALAFSLAALALNLWVCWSA